MTSRNVARTPLPPSSAATTGIPPVSPEGESAACPPGPLEELDALAHEIADELSQGEWVPSVNLYRYRALKRKLAE